MPSYPFRFAYCQLKSSYIHSHTFSFTSRCNLDFPPNNFVDFAQSAPSTDEHNDFLTACTGNLRITQPLKRHLLLARVIFENIRWRERDRERDRDRIRVGTKIKYTCSARSVIAAFGIATEIVYLSAPRGSSCSMVALFRGRTTFANRKYST